MLNNKSIAFNCAKKLLSKHCNLFITSQTEKISRRTSTLFEPNENVSFAKCDLNQRQDIISLLDDTVNIYGKLDFVLHSVAYAPKTAVGTVIDCSKDDFRQTFETSVYSFIELSHIAVPYLKQTRGSIITFSFVGSRV